LYGPCAARAKGEATCLGACRGATAVGWRAHALYNPAPAMTGAMTDAIGATYHLTSYGCQMNKLDSELVESRLRQRGYRPAASEAEASVVLLNTCSVRQHAEDRVWSKLGVLRQRKRREPGLVVGVLGCMAQEHRRFLLARMPHVDLVVGPSA